MSGIRVRLSGVVRNRRLRRLVIAVAAAIGVIGGLNWIVFPLPRDALHRASGVFVYSRDGHLLNCFTSPDRFWRKPVRLAQISPQLQNAVITCEDRWFRYHPGFNPVSLALAAVDNMRAGKFVRGGSTITMQIARMMEPKSRTIPNKIIEILRSMQLELNYSKDELLEIYFNLAPYGGNIEGVGAASYLYFDKSPGQLSLSEIAILTAIPSSPSQFRPDRDLAKCVARRNRVLSTLRNGHVISAADYEQALKEEIRTARVAAAVSAPHFCQTMAATYPRQPEIRSTLDYKLQVTCEQLARGYQGMLVGKGIQNLSLVVIDNRSGELLAMVGSADFADIANHGQVNGALARRSPGSAMKPFVYALGFGKGIISPALKVEDLPVNYAGYIPVNYDEQYHGIVSVSEALIQSLNVPAVNLTAKVGLKEFFDLLGQGGISTLDKKYSEYGLPLVLGSCEVNLLELSNLYATLARGGSYLPTRMFKSAPQAAPTRLLSTEASYLVTEVLAELKRPDLPTSWEFTTDMPRVAWKTGTSYGRKDAWAIGYNPEYTVGVWAGNFSAEGSIAIVGAEIAAPLMFNVFDQLCPEGEKSWFTSPSSIATREVCALTGRVASDACPDKISEHYIPGVSPTEVCRVHTQILVDARTGFQLCRYCSAGKKTKVMVVEEWSPRLAAWLMAKGMISAVPAHNPQCKGIFAGEAPVITSPESGAVYVIRQSAPVEYQHILFEASAAADCRQVHWFLDGQLYASSGADSKVFYAPKKGRHELMCVDSYGRSASIAFQVQ